MNVELGSYVIVKYENRKHIYYNKMVATSYAYAKHLLVLVVFVCNDENGSKKNWVGFWSLAKISDRSFGILWYYLPDSFLQKLQRKKIEKKNQNHIFVGEKLTYLGKVSPKRES